MNAGVEIDSQAVTLSRPDPLPTLLTDNTWITRTIADITGKPIDTVRQRLYAEEHEIGVNVRAAMSSLGVAPHVWSDDLARSYVTTDAFLFELVSWNRNANKVKIRGWINGVLGRLSQSSLDVLTFGDGIGCDSLYFTQAGHRVTYCEVGELSQRFAGALFDAAKLKFNLAHDLDSLRESSFDVIVCLDVLEHVPDPPALLERLAKFLRPGGLLISSAPFFTIDTEFPTHLASNRSYAGSLGSLYGPHGLVLVDGRPFLDPVVLSRLPVKYQAGLAGLYRRALVRMGAIILKLTCIWSWPHRMIARALQRRAYRYFTIGLEPSPLPCEATS